MGYRRWSNDMRQLTERREKRYLLYVYFDLQIGKDRKVVN